MSQINPEDLIRAADPGSMVYAVGMIDGERLVSLFIREDPLRIAALSNPLVELRAGLFTERHSVLVAVMAQINQELYESWWNYHQPDGQVRHKFVTDTGFRTLSSVLKGNGILDSGHGGTDYAPGWNYGRAVRHVQAGTLFLPLKPDKPPRVSL